jgi:hypothetical protein
MTPEQYREANRLALGRRLNRIRKLHNLPPLTRAVKTDLVERLLRVNGDPPTDPDLRVLYRYVCRGFLNDPKEPVCTDLKPESQR